MANQEPDGLPGHFDFALVPVPALQFLAPVDSSSPAFWTDGSLVVFNSVDGGQTYRSSGISAESLNDRVLIQLPEPHRPGKVWIEAVWNDLGTGVLYGWYHFEPADLVCLTAPMIAAVSGDGGLTWEDKGFIIENGYGVDCDFSNGSFSGGSGDFSVILEPESQYFYFLFSNYAGPLDQQGVGVARSKFQDKGQPDTVFKYYNDGWTEPGLGGNVTALLPSSTGWEGPFVEAYWGPSVHWNTYVKRYVALLNHAEGEGFTQEGIYVAFSQDVLHWSRPQKMLDGGDWYPQVIGLDQDATDSVAGKTMRFYEAGISCYMLEFSARRR